MQSWCKKSNLSKECEGHKLCEFLELTDILPCLIIRVLLALKLEWKENGFIESEDSDFEFIMIDGQLINVRMRGSRRV